MKLALLKGNRFNPWHLTVFGQMDGVEVTAFRAESEIQEYFKARGADTLPFPVKPIYFDYQAGSWLKRNLKRITMNRMEREPRILPFHEELQGFDCILSWELFTDWSAQAVEAKERYGIPLAIMVWDNMPFNNEATPERKAIKGRVRNAADVFIVHSDLSREMLLEEGVDASRIQKIWPGADTQRFTPGKGDRDALELREDDIVLLFVGWLLPRKGLDYLLEAVRILLNTRPELAEWLQVLVVGSGPGKDRVKAIINVLDLEDRCTFAGSVPYTEMPSIYQAADIFVLPSIDTPTWKEQFGMSLIEAMSCGLPCVGTQSGAIPEIAGEHAVLCPPEDGEALADALAMFLEDAQKREQNGKDNRDVAAARYDLDKHGAALAMVLKDLL